MPNLEGLDDLARRRIQYGDGPSLLGSYPDLLAVRSYLDAFGLGSNR